MSRKGAPSPDVEAAEQAVRERMWRLLEEQGVARFPGAWGRIPNFVGAERAASHLAATEEWRRARVVKANPDSPQLPVRVRALEEGKLVYMAVPKLATAEPFLRLDPARLRVSPRQAASTRGAFRCGEPVAVDRLEHVDLVVCGSVAVNRGGLGWGKEGVLGPGVWPVEGSRPGGRPDRHRHHRPRAAGGGRRAARDGARLPRGRGGHPGGRVPDSPRPRPRGILVHHLTPEKVETVPVLRGLLEG